MTLPRLLRGSIKQVSNDLRTNQLAATALIAESLSLTDQLKHLNCFITVTDDHAIGGAQQTDLRLEAGKSTGPLDGVPIAVKDNFCTKGVRTTCASKMLEGFIPTYNATVYERLKQQGAVLVGKTNLDQFGMGSGTVDSIFGPTKNVWGYDSKDWRIAGGSSGGSAVAVAAGICFGALGSDTGGSTRNPASYCGVVGLKPTYGLVSRHGLIPLVNSMDVPGIMTRTVGDCVEMLNTVAGPDPLDSTTLKQPYTKISLKGDDELRAYVRSLRIGIPREYHCPGLSPEVQATWSKVADLLEEAGAKVKQVSLPNTAASIFVYSILNQCEVASNMARYDGIEYGHRSDENSSTEQLYASTRAAGFNPVVKGRILAGNFFLLRRNYEKYFQKALRVRRLIANDFVEVFKDVDFLLTPTTLSEAPLFSDFASNSNRDQCAIQDFCTQPANMAGIPAVSLPIRLSANHLPLSVQLMGDNLSEHGMLNLARWLEREVGFTDSFYE